LPTGFFAMRDNCLRATVAAFVTLLCHGSDIVTLTGIENPTTGRRDIEDCGLNLFFIDKIRVLNTPEAPAGHLLLNFMGQGPRHDVKRLVLRQVIYIDTR
jgi:hypothetical protein